MSQTPSNPASPMQALAWSVASGALFVGTPALADTTAGVDVSVSGSVASNPFQEVQGGTTVAASAQINPWVSFADTGGAVTLRGALNFDRYLSRRYGNDFSALVSANGHKRLSERVDLRGSASFVSTRRTLQVLAPLPDLDIQDPLPTAPLPDVTFGGTRARFTSAGADFALNINTSTRGSLTLGAGGRIARVDQAGRSDYNTYSGSAGYDHRLSERTSITADVGVTRSDYLGTRVGDGTTFTPRLGMTQKLGSELNFSASLGVAISSQRGQGGTTRRFSSLSGEARLCNSNEREQMCLAASRSAEASSFGGGISNVLGVAFSMSRRVGERTTLSGAATYSRTGAVTLIGRNSVFESYGVSAQISHGFSSHGLSVFAAPAFSKTNNRDFRQKANFQLAVGVSASFGPKR